MAGKWLCAIGLIGIISANLLAKENSTTNQAAIRQAPKVLNPKERGIGRLISDFEFTDVNNRPHRLGDFAKSKAIVIAVTSTSCPISKKYLPTLVNLAKRFGKQDVTFILINPMATDKPDAIQKAAAELPANGIYVHDPKGTWINMLGLTSTADALLLDAARTVRFHGAVDDQYGFGYSIESPRKNYLIAAIDELLSNQPIFISATEAPGCHLEKAKTDVAVSSVTYHNRISRLVQSNCGECHRDGGVAPFSLATRDDLIAHAKMIETVVDRGTMPPWFAVSADKSSNPWLNDCSLSEHDKMDLLNWLKGDRTEGDAKDAAVPLKFSSDWTMGEPDLIAKFPEAVPIQATGFMRYKNVTVETTLNEDKWIQAIEVRPGKPEVVHHILVFVRPPRGADQKRDPGDEINYWGIYVPGNSKQVFPDGFARKLPKGSQIRFQMHYTPNGTATEDLTQIGFKFADKTPEFEVKTASLVNIWFEIPPGADNYTDSAKFKLPSDATVMGYLPHMHLRGKSARYEAILPDGKQEVLLDIPRYDFNWQLLYRYTEPRTFPKGTTMKFTAGFDNSEKNPANPDPKATVRWGEQTNDEMLLGYIEYFIPVAKQGSKSDDPFQFALSEDRDQMLFMSLDANDDGKLSSDELKAITKNPRFKQANPLIVGAFFVSLDTDKDGMLSFEEFKKIRDLLQKPKNPKKS